MFFRQNKTNSPLAPLLKLNTFFDEHGGNIIDPSAYEAAGFAEGKVGASFSSGNSSVSSAHLDEHAPHLALGNSIHRKLRNSALKLGHLLDIEALPETTQEYIAAYNTSLQDFRNHTKKLEAMHKELGCTEDYKGIDSLRSAIASMDTLSEEQHAFLYASPKTEKELRAEHEYNKHQLVDNLDKLKNVPLQIKTTNEKGESCTLRITVPNTSWRVFNMLASTLFFNTTTAEGQLNTLTQPVEVNLIKTSKNIIQLLDATLKEALQKSTSPEAAEFAEALESQLNNELTVFLNKITKRNFAGLAKNEPKIANAFKLLVDDLGYKSVAHSITQAESTTKTAAVEQPKEKAATLPKESFGGCPYLARLAAERGGREGNSELLR